MAHPLRPPSVPRFPIRAVQPVNTISLQKRRGRDMQGCQERLATLWDQCKGIAGAQGRHPCREQSREPGATAPLCAVERSSPALSLQALRVREEDLQGVRLVDPPRWVPGDQRGGRTEPNVDRQPAAPTLGLPPLCAFVPTGAGGDGRGPISVP